MGFVSQTPKLMEIYAFEDVGAPTAPRGLVERRSSLTRHLQMHVSPRVLMFGPQTQYLGCSTDQGLSIGTEYDGGGPESQCTSLYFELLGELLEETYYHLADPCETEETK